MSMHSVGFSILKATLSELALSYEESDSTTTIKAVGKQTSFWLNLRLKASLLLLLEKAKPSTNAGCTKDAAGNRLLNEEEDEGYKEKEKEVKYKEEEKEEVAKRQEED